MLIGRITDVVLSFPTLIVVISVVAFVGPSLTTLIVAIGLCESPTACRIVRGLTLSLRQRDSIQAAVALGATSWHVLRRHIAPEVVAPLTVVATLLVAQAITLEAALSFLGLGVPQPTASWGNMLNAASSLTTLQSMPWLWLPPGIAIAVTILAVNFVGDGLRDAVDPRQSR
jgi:peptide/nickel transport system permease protein